MVENVSAPAALVIPKGGSLIRGEAGIEIRTDPKNYEIQVLWIGNESYPLIYGKLEEFGLKTPINELEAHLIDYNPAIIQSLKNIRVSPEGLAVILARVLIGQREDEKNKFRNEAEMLRRKLKNAHLQ